MDRLRIMTNLNQGRANNNLINGENESLNPKTHANLIGKSRFNINSP